MPDFDVLPPGTFCWPELATTDQKAAVAFYKNLFGWDASDQPIGPDETLVKRGDLAGARAQYDRAAAIAPQSGWLRFVLVPQLEKAGK